MGSDKIIYHYENTPVENTANFNGCKNDNLQLILFFLIFAQNIDGEYTLEPPH